jgi:hypothetical protein
MSRESALNASGLTNGLSGVRSPSFFFLFFISFVV